MNTNTTVRVGMLTTVVALLVTCALPAMARAQSCGDLNGNGVDVIDASNVARAAVGLASACTTTPLLCDLDGDGQITVLDSASASRRAVGLPGANNCPTNGPDVTQAVLQDVQMGLGYGFGFIPGTSEASRAAQIAGSETVACDSGFIQFDSFTTEFFDCRFGVILIDGTIFANDTFVSFDLFLSDDETGETLEFFGDLFFDANFQFLNGNLTFDSSDFGFLDIEFNNVSTALTTFNTPVSGSVTVMTNVGNIQSIQQTFNGVNPSDVVVVFADQTVGNFQFNVMTGELISTSLPPPTPRIAFAEITFSTVTNRFAVDNVTFNPTLTFDEPGFAQEEPVEGQSVQGVTFQFDLNQQISFDAEVTVVGPGETPRLSPPYIEGDADGVLRLLFNPPVSSVSYDFAVNETEGTITSSTLRIFDANFSQIAAASQFGRIPPGFFFAEGSLGLTQSGSVTSAASRLPNPSAAPGGAGGAWRQVAPD